MLKLPLLQEISSSSFMSDMVYLSLSPAPAGTSPIGFSGRRPWILEKPETLLKGQADPKGRPARFPWDFRATDLASFTDGGPR
jgi:hypothetical protein